jgi:hypothetical protein
MDFLLPAAIDWRDASAADILHDVWTEDARNSVEGKLREEKEGKVFLS